MTTRTIAIAALALFALNAAAPIPSTRAQQTNEHAAEAHDRARALLSESKKARDGGDFANARTGAAAAIELLIAAPDGGESGDRPDLMAELGALALETGETRAAEKAWRAVVDARTRTLPDDHPDLQAARAQLAAALQELGDLPAAKALQEKVVAVLSRTLAEDHLELQIARRKLAATLKDVGDLPSAKALQEKVLEVLGRTLPDDDLESLTARGDYAMTIRALGDLKGARAMQEAVLEVGLRTLPDDHKLLVLTRHELGVTLLVSGDLRGARPLFERTIERLTRTLPDEHLHLNAARFALAQTLFLAGDLQGASPLIQQVVDVLSRTLPDDHPSLQSARSLLSLVLYKSGDLRGAAALSAKVLEVRSRTLPDDHPHMQSSRTSLAAMLAHLGDLQGARTLLDKVIEVLSRSFPDEHPDLQRARSNLAATLQLLGDLQGARALQERVLEVSSRTLPDDHSDLQGARSNLAATLVQLGDFQGARTLLEKVIEVLSRGNSQDLHVVRANLAITLIRLGDLEGAESLLETALEFQSRTLPDDHPYLQSIRKSLADVHFRLGDLEGAKTLEEKVLEVASRSLPDDHPQLQVVRMSLASTIYRIVAERRAHARGEAAPLAADEGARVALRDLLGAYARGVTRAAFSAVTDASSREAEERLASLGADVGVAISITSGLGPFVPDPEWERLAFVASESLRGAALASAQLARAARGDVEYARLRARVREATAELTRLAQKGASADEFARVRGDLESAEREIVRRAAPLSGGRASGPAAEFDSLAARVRTGEAFVAFRRYARESLETSEPPRWSTSASLCAFILRGPPSPGSPPREALVRVELGPIVPIEAAVERWRESITAGRERGARVVEDPASEGATRGEELRRLVLDPLRDALAGAARIVVVPDDVLHTVPLDALPAGSVWDDGDDGREPMGSGSPLGAVLRVELRSSLFEITRDDVSVGGEPALLAIGHASFDGEPVAVTSESGEDDSGAVARAGSPPRVASEAGPLRGGPWERGFSTLPETRAEVRAIGDYFEDVFGEDRPRFLLERKKAAKDNLVSLAPKARFLHVATHGWFAPESVRSLDDPEPIDAKSELGTRMTAEDRIRGMSPMLLCGLALAGANLPATAAGRIPGLVTAEELATLDLTNCELAVLSACDTNVGVRRAGQGVASLQRALHMAGARSVITSLWKVPDEATKELMVDFYRRMWVEKKEKAVALWEAKMKLRDATDERGRPKYTTRDWAAWVLTGDPK